MTDGLVAFLRDRLDEDEQVARAATAGPWHVNDEDYAESIYSAGGTDVVAGSRWSGSASVFESTEDARHIARHHPARVLAEVDAKRRILGWADSPALPDYERRYVLDALALPYAGHPDYRPEWAPES